MYLYTSRNVINEKNGKSSSEGKPRYICLIDDNGPQAVWGPLSWEKEASSAKNCIK